MTYKIKRLIGRVGEWVLNTILNFYLNKITNLSIFYTIVFTTSWLLCYYKLNNLQLETANLDLKECKSSIIFNKKFLFINTVINDATIVDLKEYDVPENVVINIKDNCIINKKIDVDSLYKLANEKKSLNEMLAIEDDSYSLWQKFKKENKNNIKNFATLKKEEEIYENAEKINNDITILKKTKIKLLFGLGLLIASDILLKSIFC